MNELHLIICSLLLIPVHEFGHYLAARREGIYKGWGIFPNPHIKLTQPYGSRFAYLSGFAASLLLFPYWAISQGLASWLWFLLLCLSGACVDISVFFLYGWMMKRRKAKVCPEA